MPIPRYDIHEDKPILVPEDTGDYVKYDDMVKLKENLLQAIENSYHIDDDDYVSGKYDAKDKVELILTEAGIG